MYTSVHIPVGSISFAHSLALLTVSNDYWDKLSPLTQEHCFNIIPLQTEFELLFKLHGTDIKDMINNYVITGSPLIILTVNMFIMS